MPKFSLQVTILEFFNTIDQLLPFTTPHASDRFRQLRPFQSTGSKRTDERTPRVKPALPDKPARIRSLPVAAAALECGDEHIALIRAENGPQVADDDQSSRVSIAETAKAVVSATATLPMPESKARPRVI